MAEFIVKLTRGETSWFLLWSTNHSSPSAVFDNEKELEEHFIEVAVNEARANLAEALARVQHQGTSSYHYKSAEAAIESNCAGKNGTRLTIEQIIDHYCLGPDDPWESPPMGESDEEEDEEDDQNRS